MSGSGPPPPPAKGPPPASVKPASVKPYSGKAVSLSQSVADLRAKAAAASGASTATPPFQFENDNLSWLTYESIYNDEKYTHTDDVRPMGVYNMPLGNLRIVIASNVVDSETRLKALMSIFFPSKSLSLENLKLLLYRPWDSDKSPYDEAWANDLPKIVKNIEDEANKNKLELPRARLPYNVVNNDNTAKSLGTRYPGSPAGEDDLNKDIKLEPQTWQMWQTASRSCFSRPLKSEDTSPPGVRDATIAGSSWNYVDRGENEVPKGAKAPSANAFNIAQKDLCYSVKTGVVFVGKDNQGSSKVNNLGNKATLEPDAIVATLRTEFMLAMDYHYENRGVKSEVTEAKKQLVILPEALTVTCLKSTIMEDGQVVNVVNDGFQLRDLSRLDSKMRYFPALSTPYVKGNGNFKTWKPQQDLTEDEFKEWNMFWSTNYAARIGETKALLHILYGFAPLTPNMQNFVFEVDPASMTLKRTILRDVLDFRLHTSWVRVCLSAEGDQEKTLQTSLCDSSSPLSLDPTLPSRIKKLFTYEATTNAPTADTNPPKLLSVSETGTYAPLDVNDLETKKITQNGTTNDVEVVKVVKPGEVLYAAKLQFFSGLQLNFFAYSAPYRGDRITAQSGDPPQWKRSYLAVLDWGLEHATAFVLTVNRLLTSNKDIPVKLKYQGAEPKEYAGKEITKDFLRDLKVKDYHKTSEKPDPRATTTFTLGDMKIQLGNATSRAGLDIMHKRLCAWDFLVSGIIEEAIYKDFFVRKMLRNLLRAKK